MSIYSGLDICICKRVLPSFKKFCTPVWIGACSCEYEHTFVNLSLPFLVITYTFATLLIPM